MLSLPLRRSRLELLFTLCCHLLALLALTLTDLAPLLLGIVAALIASSLLYAIVCAVSSAFENLQRIDITDQNSILVYPDRHLTMTPPRVRYCSEWIIVLQFAPVRYTSPRVGVKGGRVITVRLFPDSLDNDDDRRLRCYLRFECPARA